MLVRQRRDEESIWNAYSDCTLGGGDVTRVRAEVVCESKHPEEQNGQFMRNEDEEGKRDVLDVSSNS